MGQDKGGDWQVRFKRSSDESCARHLEEASKAELGKAAALAARNSLAGFAKHTLWRVGDGVDFYRWGRHIEFRWCHGTGMGAEKSFVSESCPEARLAWQSWRSGDRVGAAATLAGAIEMGALGLFKSRALEGSQERRDLLAASLGSSALEQALRVELLRAAPKERDPAAYPSMVRDLFSKRVKQLQSQDLLPAASFATVEWRVQGAAMAYAHRCEGAVDGAPSLRCMLEWRAEPGSQHPSPWASKSLGAAAGLAAQAQMQSLGQALGLGSGVGGGMSQGVGGIGNGFGSSTGMSMLGGHAAPRTALSMEVSFWPGVGWGGMFQVGGWIHGFWIRLRGAERAMEADWTRFEAKLAEAHGALLAQVREHGGLDGLARADKVELRLGLQEAQELREDLEQVHGKADPVGKENVASPAVTRALRL